MSYQEGDLCPRCKEGHITFHPLREQREDVVSHNTQSFNSWKCDKNGCIIKVNRVVFHERVGGTSDRV